MNISGKWTYNEDFEYGTSVGEVEFAQTGNEVFGVFTFTEKVENNYEIDVIEKVKGTVIETNLVLNSTDVIAKQHGREIDYLPNTFEVHLVSENKLVGSTFDSEEVCGVFVLERV